MWPLFRGAMVIADGCLGWRSRHPGYAMQECRTVQPWPFKAGAIWRVPSLFRWVMHLAAQHVLAALLSQLLIIYVGAIGSAWVGAGIMLTFSLGVAIPFLLSAWFISKSDSVVQFLAQKARVISLCQHAADHHFRFDLDYR